MHRLPRHKPAVYVFAGAHAYSAGSGISAVRLGSSALSIAFDPELRRELGINPSDHNSGGGGGGGDGSNSGKGKAGSNGGAKLFIVPDTSKLGFCWTELYEASRSLASPFQLQSCSSWQLQATCMPSPAPPYLITAACLSLRSVRCRQSVRVTPPPPYQSSPAPLLRS